MSLLIQVGLPYLIAVYMVRDWLGQEASEEKVGRMTGLLVRGVLGTMHSHIPPSASCFRTCILMAIASILTQILHQSHCRAVVLAAITAWSPTGSWQALR